ncbi:hypothetical protein JOF56_009727 [Kibdelosporangium banguiense]|uniref:Uncharacterized protein n=1 Tax=Kibdelosporangium banguiense TaxID=1365924 RepID=A0ABS4TY62_9PSEU|nr:hypothetical protein [Kibdelosporangium banguiense]MBP2329342.1 hypothetical protein [Kibdelosporangium banguiense]
MLQPVDGLWRRGQRETVPVVAPMPVCASGKMGAVKPLAALSRGLRRRQRATDLSRADIVDAELASMHRSPADGVPVWSIDYRGRGGFIATGPPSDGATPCRFWGTAPTARAAAHVLSCYFHDQPPQVVFDPPLPATPPPLFEAWRGADLSLEGPSIPELLARRGPVYDQHVAACRTARDLLRRHGDIQSFLAQRAVDLNATDPQLPSARALDSVGTLVNGDQGGVARTVQWVPTRLVVATHHPTWGQFGGFRNHSPYNIASGLLRSNDLDAFTTKLFTDAITLERIPAWAGPIYCISDGGNHRIHTARMLQLPWLAASVQVAAIAPAWTTATIVFREPHSVESQHRPLTTRVAERTQLIAGLIRRRVIDGELVDAEGQRYPVLRCRYLPATWLLRTPTDATQVNAIYENRYPGALAQLGIPTEIGTDPTAWARWLTTP